jgi:sporulation related protein
MADNFRTFRRDPPARGAALPRDSVADPLAELARLIGQSGPRSGHSGGPESHRYEDAPPVSQVEWAAGDGAYAEPAQDTHADYATPASHEAAWSHDADDRERGYDEPPAARRYSDPDPAFDAEPPRYASPAHEDYAGDDHPPYAAHDRYAADVEHEPAYEEHEQDTRAPSRSGTILILAVLGLAVLGTAGAFGYRAMFGKSVVSGLPPIIKPAEGPIKVQPSQEAQAGKPGQSEPANKGTGERLVEHQEQPVDVQSANPPVPRVVQTIPVISNAQAAPIPAGGQPAEVNLPAPNPPPPQQPVVAPPFAANPPAAPAPQQIQPLGPAAPGAKQVHTVVIRPGQAANANPAPAAPPPAARAARTHEPVQRQPRQTANAGGPLSIVPGPEGDVRPPARNRIAMRAPEPVEATSAAGGYAVQVTSRRSEAEAETAFRALQAKYPQQLGGRRAIVRRADLGAKGVYYRALVGPFASGEQANELCGKLKAAGGSCIVQRN